MGEWVRDQSKAFEPMTNNGWPHNTPVWCGTQLPFRIARPHESEAVQKPSTHPREQPMTNADWWARVVQARTGHDDLIPRASGRSS
jgi:hypothetical protein